MSKVVDLLDWAIDTIREKVMFGRDELGAALSRELRAKGVMLGAKKYILQLEEELEKEKKVVDAMASFVIPSGLESLRVRRIEERKFHD